MIVSLTLVRYRRFFIPFALLAMAVHRIPLLFTRGCSFWKLLGTGKNGTFDLHPDWQQWGLLAVWDDQQHFDNFYTSSFISAWWKIFTTEKWTILCEPLSSHGKWSGKEPFNVLKSNEIYAGPVIALTRARIRIRHLIRFWKNVDSVAKIMNNAPGYITSAGIGEAPLYLQATFSVWQTLDNLKAFAYSSIEHSNVIKRTRKENWYAEELFARFKPIVTLGTLKGKDPVKGVVPNIN